VRLLMLLQNDALEKVSRGFREYSRSQGTLALIFGVILGFGVVAALLYAILSGRDRMVGRRTFLKLARNRTCWSRSPAAFCPTTRPPSSSADPSSKAP
jgi:hypothetical protein